MSNKRIKTLVAVGPVVTALFTSIGTVIVSNSCIGAVEASRIEGFFIRVHTTVGDYTVQYKSLDKRDAAMERLVDMMKTTATANLLSSIHPLM